VKSTFRLSRMHIVFPNIYYCSFLISCISSSFRFIHFSSRGINELLKTGWKVQGTSNDKKVLEIYDKSKWGYRENDSMLIGGFEQREAVVGAEITLTHAPSETNTQANISVTQESHHTPPSPVATTRTPTGSVVNNTTSTVYSQHQYGSPPTTPGGGGSGHNNGSPPL
jgi:hypothetical protein